MAFPPGFRRLRPLVVCTVAFHVLEASGLPIVRERAAWAGSTSSSRGPGDLLRRGQKQFDDQEYEEAIQTLSAALLRPNLEKGERIEIYRLLSLCYITLGRQEEAEAAVRGLLAQDPTYELPKSESPRFRDVFAAVRKRWEAEGRPGLSEEAASEKRPTLQHSLPVSAQAQAPLALSVRVSDPGRRLKGIQVFYRTGSRGPYQSLAAPVSEDVARVNLPGAAVRGPMVEYYLQGVGADGLPLVSSGDAAAPHRVPVTESSSGWVLPLAIGGGVLGIAAAAGVMALAGVFQGSSSPGRSGGGSPSGEPRSIVTVSIRE